jgi:EmrB/QacA subfamily drug resistance transporter
MGRDAQRNAPVWITGVNDQGGGHGPPHASKLTQGEVRLIVLCVLLATLIAALDQTIVSTALPTIGRELGDAQQLTWVVTAYLLASTVVTPIYGKLSDIYGRRSTLLISVGVFVAGSIACALSPSMLVLIIARTFQGLGGGGLIALSQTVIGDVIAPKERPRYQAYISSAFVIASLAGPLLGGFIAQHLNWSLIFWINPPIGLLALLPMYSLLRKLPRGGHRHRIDIAGAVLLVVATTALMLLLSWGGVKFSWTSPPIIGLGGIFTVFAVLFFARQHVAPEPLLPLSVLANQVILTATLASALGTGTSVGLMIFTPIYFESVRMLSPGMSGVMLVPLMVGTAIGASIAGRLMASVSHYKVLPVIGLVVSIAAMTVMSLAPQELPLAVVELMLALSSMGFGTVLPIATNCVQNAASGEELGTATGVMVFARSLAGAVAVAIFGAILFGQLHASGNLQSISGGDFTKSGADFASIFRWIFGAAAVGFVGALAAILAMRKLPLRDHVASEDAVLD